MNPFALLSLPLPEVLRVIAKESDKIRVFYAYITKLNLNEEQPRVFRSKVHFNEIQRSIRENPDLPMQELDPSDRMDIEKDNDTESKNSSKRIDIIG